MANQFIPDIQPAASLLTMMEKQSLMAEGWSNNPDVVLRQEWLKRRKPRQNRKLDVFEDVLQTFGMDLHVEADEDVEKNPGKGKITLL